MLIHILEVVVMAMFSLELMFLLEQFRQGLPIIIKDGTGVQVIIIQTVS
jgi:hypothetical protein